jgi:hypothetical protein
MSYFSGVIIQIRPGQKARASGPVLGFRPVVNPLKKYVPDRFGKLVSNFAE